MTGDYANRCTCPTLWNGIIPPTPCWYCRHRVSPVVDLPSPFGMSDADVERIAQRIAELLGKATP